MLFIFISGIGIASTIIMFFTNTFFNVILAWAFYYWFSSFTSELPWAKCGHEWNVHCKDFTLINNQKENNVTQCLNGIISNASVCSNVTSLNASKIELDPVTEFWE
jgi:SNF family Na+-dependent transporter